MPELATLGMRRSDNWATDQRPKNWREGILREMPNGDAPLTAMLAMLRSEDTDDPEFNWWLKKVPEQYADVTGVYTNITLSTALASGAASATGTTLFLKMAENDVRHFRPGHTVTLRDKDHVLNTLGAKVLTVVRNGASSYISIITMETDDNGDSSTDASNCDHVQIKGNINPENGERPQAISYDPTKYYNYSGIMRTSLEISRTAMKQKLRTGNGYAELKKEAAFLHAKEIEESIMWGIKFEGTGTNGAPERQTQGMIPFIRENISTNVSSFTTVASTDYDIDFTSAKWLDEGGGELWMNAVLEKIYRYGRDEKMAFVGSGTMLQIDRLVKAGAVINLVPGANMYGIRIYQWIHPNGVLNIKRHPLFSNNAVDRNSMVVFEPEELVERIHTATHFIPQNTPTGDRGKDGKNEEFLTETGLEFHFPDRYGYLVGFGTDNGA